MNEKYSNFDIEMLNKVLAKLYLDLLPDGDPAALRVAIQGVLDESDRQFSVERPTAQELQQAAQQVIAIDASFGGEMRSYIAQEVAMYCQSTLDNPDDENRKRVESTLGTLLAQKGSELTPERQQDLADFIYNNFFDWGPLTLLLTDGDVTEILVDGPDEIYFERQGKLEDWPHRFLDTAQLMHCIRRIFRPTGARVDVSNPIKDARLPDDTRANVVLPPIALNGPTLTIRKFPQVMLTIQDLILFGCWNEDIVEFLHACIVGRLNILVAGGAGSGKTTLLNILTEMIPSDQRVVTVEPTAELRPRNLPHLVRLAARPPNSEGEGEVTMRDLLLNALRMRPDRILIGENQGPEVLDALRAMNTGHDGTMLNIHATSPHDALNRLETMIAMAHPELPLLNVRQEIASAIDLIVYQERLTDGSRKMVNVTEVTGMQGGVVTVQDIFEYRQTGTVDGRVVGYHTATGIVPKFLAQMPSAKLPLSLFTPRRKTAGMHGSRETLTVLFGDIRGFMKFSDAHSPEHVAEMLHIYFDRINHIVRQNDGLVLKYLGDAFIAHFGSSQQPIQDHALKAIKAALEIDQDLRAFHQTLPDDDHLYLGFGIDTGDVIVSSMGSDGPIDYIGDVMNVAALLQRNAGRGQIIIGESTYQQVREQVEVQKLPDLTFRGRSGTTRAYEVVGLAAHPTGE